MSAEPTRTAHQVSAIACGATFMALLDGPIVDVALRDLQEKQESFEHPSLATFSWESP